MGNLADTFIVRLRPEFRDAPIEMLMPHIPSQYQPMFAILWDHYASLEDILDTDNIARIEAMNLEQAPPHIVFAHRYRGECLQQILRQTFFETLLIIENVYSPGNTTSLMCFGKTKPEVRVFQHWQSIDTMDLVLGAK